MATIFTRKNQTYSSGTCYKCKIHKEEVYEGKCFVKKGHSKEEYRLGYTRISEFIPVTIESFRYEFCEKCLQKVNEDKSDYNRDAFLVILSGIILISGIYFGSNLTILIAVLIFGFMLINATSDKKYILWRNKIDYKRTATSLAVIIAKKENQDRFKKAEGSGIGFFSTDAYYYYFEADD